MGNQDDFKIITGVNCQNTDDYSLSFVKIDISAEGISRLAQTIKAIKDLKNIGVNMIQIDEDGFDIEWYEDISTEDAEDYHTVEVEEIGSRTIKTDKRINIYGISVWDDCIVISAYIKDADDIESNMLYFNGIPGLAEAVGIIKETGCQYVAYIKSWHEDHDESSNHPDCEVYKALQRGVPDEELIAIAEKVDPDIRAAYREHVKRRNP